MVVGKNERDFAMTFGMGLEVSLKGFVMKKAISVLVLAALPAFVFAAGEHAEKKGHDMSTMKAHDMSAMKDMKKDDHASAAGKAGDPAKVNRTVAVTMDDTMRYTPAQVSVKAGETIRFFLKNNGKIAHEMVIGTAAELNEHAEMMRKMPTMVHQEPNMLRLDPGKSGGIVWQFDKAGEFDFACLVPGHREAGMVGKLKVM